MNGGYNGKITDLNRGISQKVKGKIAVEYNGMISVINFKLYRKSVSVVVEAECKPLSKRRNEGI